MLIINYPFSPEISRKIVDPKSFVETDEFFLADIRPCNDHSYSLVVQTEPEVEIETVADDANVCDDVTPEIEEDDSGRIALISFYKLNSPKTIRTKSSFDQLSHNNLLPKLTPMFILICKRQSRSPKFRFFYFNHWYSDFFFIGASFPQMTVK